MPSAIHHVIAFDTTALRVFEQLTDAEAFAAMTGAPAEIDASPGGAFSLFGGQIVGRNVEIVPGARVVQAWRVDGWEPGVYSVTRFELRPDGDGCTLLFDHTGFPEDAHGDLDAGWHAMYWEPMKAHMRTTRADP